METKNQNEMEMAVRPVLPPSEIPAYTCGSGGLTSGEECGHVRTTSSHTEYETRLTGYSLHCEKKRREHTALSMKAVTGEIPSSDPMDIEMASTQYATVDLSKSFVIGSTRPECLAIVYNVLVWERA